jgi:putative ABC transport system ATP-binding protein
MALPSAPPVLEAKGLVRRFRADRPPVLDGVSLTLHAGEYIAVMGDSGVGKSTLLNLIAGLERPDAGTVHVDGTEVSALDDDGATLLRRRHIGFVFQAFHVLPYVSVVQNVALPLALLGVAAGERRTQALAMLERVGIARLADQYPRDLSGGELQRIAIARALIHRPRLVLADEPTGNLDPRTATDVLQLLRERIREAGGAGILITHSRAVADTADRAYALDGRTLTLLEPRPPQPVQ